MNGRGGEIRTLDFLVPDQARYRAAPRPERLMVRSTWQLPQTSSHFCSSAIVIVRERLPTISLIEPTLLVARKVIPVHHKHREYLPTICARHTRFECGHPCPRLQHPCTLADTSRRLSALSVVAAVVSATTFATVGKLASPRVVKFARCFPQPAHHAASERRVCRNVINTAELGDWFVWSPLCHDGPIHLPQPAR